MVEFSAFVFAVVSYSETALMCSVMVSDGRWNCSSAAAAFPYCMAIASTEAAGVVCDRPLMTSGAAAVVALHHPPRETKRSRDETANELAHVTRRDATVCDDQRGRTSTLTSEACFTPVTVLDGCRHSGILPPPIEADLRFSLCDDYHGAL